MRTLILSWVILSFVVVFASVGSAIDDGSLVLFFTFDKIKEKKVIDESGNGNDGVMKGNVKVVPSDIFENAISFPGGANDVIEVPDSDSLDVKEITVEAWWFQRSLPGDYPRGIQKGIGTSFEFDADSRGGKKAIDWEAHIGGWTTCNSGDAYNLNEWVHVAGAYDGKEMKIYINGKEVNSCAKGGPMGTDDMVLQMGGYTPQGVNPFDGLMDEVAIYKRALTEDEIRRDMEKGPLPELRAVAPSGKLTTTWGNIKNK